jgi:hypothetical protein
MACASHVRDVGEAAWRSLRAAFGGARQMRDAGHERATVFLLQMSYE